MCAIRGNGGMKPEPCSPRLWDICWAQLQQHSPKKGKLPELLCVFEEVACAHLLSSQTLRLKQASTSNEAMLNRLSALQAQGRTQGRAARGPEPGGQGRVVREKSPWRSGERLLPKGCSNLFLASFFCLSWRYSSPLLFGGSPRAWAEAAVWAGEKDPEQTQLMQDWRGGKPETRRLIKSGFGLVNEEKLVHRWTGMKGFSIEEDMEKINFSYITKRMR